MNLHTDDVGVEIFFVRIQSFLNFTAAKQKSNS